MDNIETKETTEQEQPYIDEANGEPVKMSLTEKAMLIMEMKKGLKSLRLKLKDIENHNRESPFDEAALIELRTEITKDENALVAMVTDFNAHIDIKADQIRREEALKGMRKEKKAELDKMDKEADNFIERTKQYIIDSLMWLTADDEKHSHKTPYRKYNVSTSAGKVIITGDVPAIFKRTPPPPEAVPDLEKIEKHINEYKDCSFAYIKKSQVLKMGK